LALARLIITADVIEGRTKGEMAGDWDLLKPTGMVREAGYSLDGNPSGRSLAWHQCRLCAGLCPHRVPGTPAHPYGQEPRLRSCSVARGAVCRLRRGELCWFHDLGTFSVSIVDPWPRRTTHHARHTPREICPARWGLRIECACSEGSGWQDCGSLSEPSARPERPG
jgi:hypothetical protein